MPDKTHSRCGTSAKLRFPALKSPWVAAACLILLSVCTTFAGVCPTCGGRGGKTVTSKGAYSTQSEWIVCPTCHGTGQVPDANPPPGNNNNNTSEADLEAERQRQATAFNHNAAKNEDDVGRMHYDKGEYDLAIQHFKRALEWWPDNSVIQQHLAAAKDQLAAKQQREKEAAEARAKFQRDKADSLGSLKGIDNTGSTPGLKGLGDDTGGSHPALKGLDDSSGFKDLKGLDNSLKNGPDDPKKSQGIGLKDIEPVTVSVGGSQPPVLFVDSSAVDLRDITNRTVDPAVVRAGPFNNSPIKFSQPEQVALYSPPVVKASAALAERWSQDPRYKEIEQKLQRDIQGADMAYLFPNPGTQRNQDLKKATNNYFAAIRDFYTVKALENHRSDALENLRRNSDAMNRAAGEIEAEERDRFEQTSLEMRAAISKLPPDQSGQTVLLPNGSTVPEMAPEYEHILKIGFDQDARIETIAQYKYLQAAHQIVTLGNTQWKPSDFTLEMEKQP